MQVARINDSFHNLMEGGALEAACQRWMSRSSVIAGYGELGNLIESLKGPHQPIDDKNAVIEALCRLAVAGDEVASVLLLWLFAGAFRNIQKRIGACPLSAEELESEMVGAFWETVANTTEADKLIGTLVSRVKKRAWQAVRKARSEVDRRADLEEEPPAPEASCSDPTHLVMEAVKARRLDELGAELILATRMNPMSIQTAAKTLGLSPAAVVNRRRRAEAALKKFLSDREP